MSATAVRLKAIRSQIDHIDQELLAGFNRRAQLARTIADIKEDSDVQGYYCPDREAQVVRKLIAANPGPLPDRDVERLFREIMSACRALQQPMRLAFLGPRGTFAEAAVFRHFGRAVETVPLESIDAVFREVESGACQYGVVPVENSTEGVVTHTLDMFLRSRLAICGEVELRIHHHLLARGGDLAAITRVYTHQQSLAQCRQWLDRNLPVADRMAVSSNAEGARRAAQEPGAAAVAGEAAAPIYGLEILAANIEDEPDNATRFLVIGEQSVAATGMDKTSLLLSARNRAGALYGLLTPFARLGINMTRIESRPSRNARWDYVFFVDIEGHAQDPQVAKAVAALDQEGFLIKVIGSYPRALAP
ncbi:MAG: prephenate dehydratase [Gammaproteobacteria bacterium]